LEIWNEQNETKLRRYVEVLHLCAADKGESAETRGRTVVRVTFQFGAQRKQIVAGEICPRNFIQSMKHSEAHRYAAAKPASNWNLALNIAGELKGLAFCGCEKFSGRISNHPADCATFAPADRYAVVKRKRHPKTIETGPEIRSAGGNTHRDLLHSPSLSCTPNAARETMTGDRIRTTA